MKSYTTDCFFRVFCCIADTQTWFKRFPPTLALRCLSLGVYVLLQSHLLFLDGPSEECAWIPVLIHCSFIYKMNLGRRILIRNEYIFIVYIRGSRPSRESFYVSSNESRYSCKLLSMCSSRSLFNKLLRDKLYVEYFCIPITICSLCL